ncbi:MAG TPA: hypothetical protein VHH88_11615, partial [Verrucomicrobiae bacterium]|nr:hypothetical protein [Verrucomicrobiae bacterium]
MRANLFLKSTAMVLLASGVASGQVIISDDYDVTGSGTGFALGSGVNSGINPPVTRLSGLAADGLRYIATDATKTAGNYSINSDALAVRAAANSGRLSLSTDGATAYD